MLTTLGPEARAAVPVLIESLKDSEIRGRMFAGEVLGAIGPHAAAAVPALRELLQDSSRPEPDERTLAQVAAQALKKIAPTPAP